MKIIDWHCDALSKLGAGEGVLNFRKAEGIDANLERLKQGNIKVQCFAVFIEPEVHSDAKFQAALDQIAYFYEEVLGKNREMKQIRNWADFFALQDNEIGALLTLEGADPIGNDLSRMEILYQLGVRSVGLTWNHANLCADGAEEPRGAGLTEFGKELVVFLNEKKMLTDVSHLSERAFWDVLDIASYPFASHSNAKALCNHPRNLTDQQAKAMFDHGGMIHVVFYPKFITGSDSATMDDLVSHIDHFATLGGIDRIGFGSDFDGIDHHVTELEHAGKYDNLINRLINSYSYEQVLGFAGGNFHSFCKRMQLV